MTYFLEFRDVEPPEILAASRELVAELRERVAATPAIAWRVEPEMRVDQDFDTKLFRVSLFARWVDELVVAA